jgi:hypothetical protein
LRSASKLFKEPNCSLCDEPELDPAATRCAGSVFVLAEHQQEECVQFTKSGKAALIAATLATLSPITAMAAEVERTTTTTTQQQQQRDDDSDFPWGLLGLLGLAGLLGMKRNKEADIHVDARHDHKGGPRT